MGTDTVNLARQRLTHSRLALQAQMNRGKPRRSSPAGHSGHDDSDADANMQDDSAHGSYGYWQIAKGAARNWWHHHPVRTVAAIAEPAFQHYAKERPLHLLGVAAAVGAAAVVIRPWRLVSLTALLAAGLRASDIFGTASQLIAHRLTDNSAGPTTDTDPRPSS
ncbi:hypothetical protein ACO2Q9_05240 [Variovorax sp. VNK109]|uniref:hypothetical protein n=1 Tax=Variovorax sp. VNK109 TaxID=3400919 RepID=UPI003C07C682